MKNRLTRRKFVYEVGLTSLSMPFLSTFGECSAKQKMENKEHRKLGIALVGLGNYAGGQLAPALQETEHCYLAGIVSGTASKREQWKAQYNLPESNVYNYQNFDSIKENKDIDIVYVVLPNNMHAAFVERAATAGKHVICEKPMALTVDECNRMITACKDAGKMLSIGYRLHFEPYNQEMQRLGREKVYGAVQKVQAGFAFKIGDPTQWRLKKALAGGGPLQDLGIYCIQGICYTTGLNPIAVTAKEGPKTDPEKFREVEESISFQLEMPDGTVHEGKASYADNMNYLIAEAERGRFELPSAFNYTGQRGITPKGNMNFPQVNEQARQMDDFALAIKQNRPTPVPGEMGKRDVQIIQAIYEAARTGKKVRIAYE